MKCQYKNFYFTNGHSLNIVYDIERNRIISVSDNVDMQKIFNILVNNPYVIIKDQLTEEEESLYSYLKNNLIENKTDNQFCSFDYFKESDFRIASASFMVAQNCNLACKYCYGGESGRFNSKVFNMNEDIAKKAIKRLVDDNIDNNIITINFFGGEPLMNFKLIQFIVNECKNEYQKNNFFFTITTNGTLISKTIAQFFREHDFKILVSIDGNEEIHNYHRKYPNGNGSFFDTLEGIEILKENHIDFSIRATLDHEFYPNYSEVVKFLDGLGCNRVIISRLINYEDDKPSFPINIDRITEETKQLKNYLDKVVEEVIEGKTPCHFPYLGHFKKIIFAKNNLMSCGAYEAATAISTDGKFYPCHRFVGMEGFDFGDVEKGVDKEKLMKQTNGLDMSTNKCLNCFGKYICQRACIRDIAKSKGFFISYDENYCNLLRETIDNSLIVYYKLLKLRPDFFNTRLVLENEFSDSNKV